jgi:hypothetical protein
LPLGLYLETNGTIGGTATEEIVSTFIVRATDAFGNTGTKEYTIAISGAAYTTPGTYSWTAPAGVYSVSVVAVGGGASGTINGGGGGGGLGWKNNIPVTPGDSYTVVVGDAPLNGYFADGKNGEDSYFIDTATVAGLGGKFRLGSYYPDSLGYGGGYVGDGGGAGGRGYGGSAFLNYYFYGGGGAGGYSGTGGAGGHYRGQGNSLYQAGGAGTGGGGGGGYGTIYGPTTPRRTYAPEWIPVGEGGGVGIYGQGDSGNTNGKPGSGGKGKLYGGGNWGYSETDSVNRNRGGGGGAVRIIWGTGQSFPNNAT